MIDTRTKLKRHESGFSMVEALVALVVLSVGMLGISGLYVTTLRSSGSAISRMQAVNLASDIGDRIRANRNATDAYADDPADNGCDEAACSAEEMAAFDLFVWNQQITRSLPGNPAGTVVIDATTTPRTYIVTISWQEAGNESLSYQMRMQI